MILLEPADLPKLLLRLCSRGWNHFWAKKLEILALYLSCGISSGIYNLVTPLKCLYVYIRGSHILNGNDDNSDEFMSVTMVNPATGILEIE